MTMNLSPDTMADVQCALAEVASELRAIDKACPNFWALAQELATISGYMLDRRDAADAQVGRALFAIAEKLSAFSIVLDQRKVGRR